MKVKDLMLVLVGGFCGLCEHAHCLMTPVSYSTLDAVPSNYFYVNIQFAHKKHERNFKYTFVKEESFCYFAFFVETSQDFCFLVIIIVSSRPCPVRLQILYLYSCVFSDVCPFWSVFPWLCSCWRQCSLWLACLSAWVEKHTLHLDDCD